jgi:hypothetical protein
LGTLTPWHKPALEGETAYWLIPDRPSSPGVVA